MNHKKIPIKKSSRERELLIMKYYLPNINEIIDPNTSGLHTA